ncbi:methylthioribulose 1-phosphate dehydratase [bacterium]|nr:methylthioribulose 1-phosphate dehydratase [bacterium]MCI0603103.1 methylthioribulose 1-phosphate dehydratase [bacterium]
MTTNDLRSEIVRISHLFYERRWSLATSSNYSARVDPNTVLITASGLDKGKLTEGDLLLIDLEGNPREESSQKASAETYLHCELYKHDPEIGAVLHTHSVFATVLSSLRNLLSVHGYEMLKALRGISTHLHTEHIPVFPNDQDMRSLAQMVLPYLEKKPGVHGFLIAGHGLYCWGRDLAEALRHTEAFEFLLECEYRKLMINDKG